MNTELLNAIKNLLVKFANENNIILAHEFGTPAKFKEFVIAFTFKQLKELGVDTKDAFDMLMGDGAFDEMANSVWESAQ